MTPVAQDDRYVSSMDESIWPSQYDFQSLSGVLNTLESMPYFKIYLPDAVTNKQAVKYSLWERPVLEYDEAGCDQSIIDAIMTLNDLS